MHHPSSTTPSPRASDRPPPGASSPPPRGELMAWKGVATAIDSLVLTHRTSPAALELIAERAIQQWSELGNAPLEIKGTELLAGGQVVLSFAEGQGLWLLPAFMAGVRTIRPLPGCRPFDLRTLTEELRNVRPEVDSLARFRDWVWSDGAEGFDVALHMSFMEVMDAAVSEETHGDALRAFRGEFGTALGADGVHIASQELDVAALREEFNVPLQLFSREIARDNLRLDPDDAAALADECEGSYGWTRIEIALTLGHPEMRSAVAPQRLARLIMQQLGEALDDRALELLASLGSREDPYVRALSEALDDPALGERLASRASPNARSAEALRRFFGVCSPRVAVGLATGLIDRATRTPDTFAWARAVALSVGLPAFVELVVTGGVREDSAATVVTILLSADAPSELLSALLKAVPPRTAAAMMTKLPPARLLRLVDLAAKLLAGDDAEVINTLVPSLLELDSPEALALVGDCLLRTLGAAWASRALHPACLGFIGRGLGRKYLLPVARSSKAEPRVRLIALRALSSHVELKEEAARWSFGELLDPPEVRARLQEMRKQLKAPTTDGRAA